jgi:hypothetical protein
MNPLEAFYDKGWYPILHTKHIDNTKHSLKNAQINFSFSYFNKVDELNNTVNDFIKNILSFKISNNKINDVYLTTSGENQKVINAICHHKDVVYVQLLRKNGFNFCNLSIDSPIFNINKFLDLSRIVDTNNSSLSYNNTVEYYRINESEISDFHILRFNTTYVDDIKINNGDALTLLLSNGNKAKLSTINGQNLLSGEDIVINGGSSSGSSGDYASRTHGHGNITSAGTIVGATSRVVVTDSSGKITSSSTVTTTDLDTLKVISSNIWTNTFLANRDVWAQSSYSFAEGYGTKAMGSFSHAEGSGTTASGLGAHAEGYKTIALGRYSHAEGSETSGTGYYSHAEGRETTAGSFGSHAEGIITVASGIASHAEGETTQAIGYASHTEGIDTKTDGDYSHAEGFSTYAIGEESHAEGYSTVAEGIASHAEGSGTTAGGIASHAEGVGTVANYDYSHACGKFNLYGDNNALFTIGNGDDNKNRSNAFMVDIDGYGYFAGDILINAEFGEDGIPSDGVWVSELGGNFAPTVHTATTSTYGLGTISAYGHVKISNDDVALVSPANGVAAGMGHSHSNYAPKVHTSSSSDYGVGTTSVYGHVKISNGDVATVSSANGLAAGMDHSHGNYALSGHTHNNYAPSSHGHGNISSAGVITGASNRVVVTDANGKITSSSTIDTTELGYLNGVTSNIQTQLNNKVSSSDFNDFTSYVDESFAPESHAVASTTYGAATTGVYGHVKISNGDVATVASANGLAAGMDHSHSNYLNIFYKDITETINPQNYNGTTSTGIKYTNVIGIYDSTSTTGKTQIVSDIRLGNLDETYYPRFEIKFNESTVGIPHFITFHSYNGMAKGISLKISGDKVKTNNYARVEYKGQTSIANAIGQTSEYFPSFSKITARKISATTYHDTWGFKDTIYFPLYCGGSPTSVTYMIKYFPDAGNYADSSNSYTSQAGVLSIIQL